MNDVFKASLLAHNKKKSRKRKRQKSTGSKIKQRKIYLSKFAEQHKEQLEEPRTGKTYGTGVALAASKKIAKEKLTAGARNPKSALRGFMGCAYYHPLYYTVLDHTSAASKQCGVK